MKSLRDVAILPFIILILRVSFVKVLLESGNNVEHCTARRASIKSEHDQVSVSYKL